MCRKQEGSAECKTCAANAEVVLQTCACSAGFFARKDVVPPEECLPCPKGVVCNTTGNAWGRLSLKVGFWQVKEWLADPDVMLDYESRLGRGVETCKVGEWTAAGTDANPLCLGGANWSMCREGHEGVKCQVHNRNV